MLHPQSSQALNHLPLLHSYVFYDFKQSLLHHKHSSAARVGRREGNVFCISFVLVGRGSLTTDDFWYACGAGETLALSKQ